MSEHCCDLIINWHKILHTRALRLLDFGSEISSTSDKSFILTLFSRQILAVYNKAK